MSGTASTAPPNPTVVNNGASINKYARRLNKYKAGQSPATLYPERTRSFQPGLSWLGDDEFESTGLAFRLARHNIQRIAASKPTSSFGSSKNVNKDANPGPGLRKNDGKKIQTRAKASNNADRKPSRPPRKDITPKSRPTQVDVMAKTETSKTVKPGVSTRSTTPNPILKPSPALQTPVSPVHVDLKSTDFTSLFGASPSLSAAPSTNTKATPTDDASRRVQLALEYHGGDYSKLVTNSLVTSQGDPLVYAENAMARRRELGSNRRNGALRIVQGMVGKSQASQPTA